MALKSGLAAQVGYATESSYGTIASISRFVPLVSESVSQKIDRMESKGIIAGRRVLDSNQWAAGDITIAGSLAHELYDRDLGLLFRHCFGSVVTTGAGPYTHTFTPGDLSGVSFTTQVGRPDVSGTVQPFTFAGCKVQKWEIACKAGEIATFSMDIVAKSETTSGTALASASYTAAQVPLTYTGGSVSIAGTTASVKEIKLSGDNKLDDGRRFIGSQTISEPLEADLREYSGDLTLEFDGLTQYNRFVTAGTASLVSSFTAGSYSLTITQNVRFDGESPKVGGRGIIELPCKYKAIGATDAAAITAVYVTSNATPT